MTNQEKLDLINTIEVIGSEGGDYAHVSIEATEENYKILESVGFTKEYVESFIDEEQESIDISTLGFDCGASYYTGSKFVIDRKNDAIQDLQESLDEYWNNINAGKEHRKELFTEIIMLAGDLTGALAES